MLRDDGVIFISIDDNEVTNLRKICDEVFGEENFVAQIVWQKIHSIKNDAKYFSVNHDYILVYCRSLSDFSVNLLPRTAEMNERYKNPDNDPRGAWQSGDLVANGERSTGYYDVISPKTGKTFNVEKGKHWVYSQENLLQMIANDEIWFGVDGNSFPRKKRFLKDVQDGRTPSTIWLSDEVGHNQTATKEIQAIFDNNKYFDYPKPIELLKQIIRIGTSCNDIILDFFSGSATTAHAVMQLNAEDGGNRRFICVQLPELCDEKSEAYKAGYKNICEIGKERIRRAGDKIQSKNDKLRQTPLLETEEEINLFVAAAHARGSKGVEQVKPLFRQIDISSNIDTGFRVFKLDTSNLKTWDGTPVTEGDMQILFDRMNGMIHRVKSDRSDMDMIYEIMLKLGVPLTYRVNQIKANGKNAYTVGDECLLLICLAEDVRPEDVEAMAEYAPAKLIIARDSFKDDTAMANAHYILRDKGIELKLI